ncbi:hypothetical protein [Leifsonia shinshuensis]|uniref:hypothetical protein n=1 Tax=Leifsonia shinshuensis TaxID=150026 RepID=UPI0028595240|nr:hypothetical protein [Leifsonia shinshuensis]MDR6972724.1 hypothetical protein [Leifsonia shinshuensis]
MKKALLLPLALIEIGLLSGCAGLRGTSADDSIADQAADEPSAQVGECEAKDYTEGGVNIQMIINNDTDQVLTLASDGLNGSLKHWNAQPQATVPAGGCEIITGYSHNMFAELSMYVEYRTGSGETAMFTAQANDSTGANHTNGTGVVKRDGSPAQDLRIDASISTPSSYDWATATETIEPLG